MWPDQVNFMCNNKVPGDILGTATPLDLIFFLPNPNELFIIYSCQPCVADTELLVCFVSIESGSIQRPIMHDFVQEMIESVLCNISHPFLIWQEWLHYKMSPVWLTWLIAAL